MLGLILTHSVCDQQIVTEKKDLLLDASAGAPVASIDLEGGDLNYSPGLGVELNAPTLNGNLPSPNKPSADATFTVPSLGLSGPEANDDGTVKVPDGVSVVTHQLKAPTASLDADTQEMKTSNLKTPKFTMPHFNLPQIKIPKGEMDVSGDGKLKTPDLNGPDIKLETQNADIQAPSGKFMIKGLKWKGPKVKGPSARIDADLPTPDATPPTAEIAGNLGTTDNDLNIPKAELQGPDLNANVDIEGPSHKISWLHLKPKKKPKLKANVDANLNTSDVDLAVPKVESEIKTPDLDLNLPKTDAEGPDLSMQTPNTDVETFKINWPHLKLKKPKNPKVDLDAGIDVNAPDINVSTPKIESDINEPDVELNLQKDDLEGPSGDLQGPYVDTDASSRKIKWPHLKWRKSKTDMNLNANLNTQDVDVTSPKVDIDVKPLDANIEASSSKHKIFTLKKPKFLISRPKMKTTNADLNADLTEPDVSLSPEVSLEGLDTDLNLPKAEADVKASNIDIESPSGKFKGLSLKKPKWSVSGPTLSSPDCDLNAEVPDLNLSDPKFDSNINAPDVNLEVTKGDLGGPEVDIHAPDGVAPSGKFKWFNFKKPKFGTVKGQKADIDVNDVNVTEVDLKAADLDSTAPKVNFSAPEIEGGVEVPYIDANTKGLNLDLNSSNLGIDPCNKTKLLNQPDMDTSPHIDLNTPGLKNCVDAPDVDINVHKPEFNGTNVNLQAPMVDVLTIKEGHQDLDLDAHTDMDLQALKTKFSLPAIKGSDVEGEVLDLPKADIQVPGVTLKAPDNNLPSYIDGNPLTPNTDTKLSKVELEATADYSNVDINFPSADFKLPETQLNKTDADFGDFKIPHFKLPTHGLSSSEVGLPSVHSSVEPGIEAPKVSTSNPTANTNISIPPVGMNVLTVDSSIKEAKVDSKPSTIEGPIVEEKISSFITSTPEVEASLHTSEMNIKAGADAEARHSPKSKLRWPFKWGLKSGSGTDEEGSGVDSETDVSNTEVEVPAFKFHRLPTNSIELIGRTPDGFGVSKLDTEPKDYVVSKGIRLPIVNVTSKEAKKIDVTERLKMAKEKVPLVSVSTNEIKTDIDQNPAASALDVGVSTETGNSSFVRGGTFKVEKPESILSLVAPEISSSDENDKLSLSLSNMLGLNI